jgi:hypothetical protein
MFEAFQHLYNHHRPHGTLAGKTPAEYLVIRRANESPSPICHEPGSGRPQSRSCLNRADRRRACSLAMSRLGGFPPCEDDPVDDPKRSSPPAGLRSSSGGPVIVDQTSASTSIARKGLASCEESNPVRQPSSACVRRFAPCVIGVLAPTREPPEPGRVSGLGGRPSHFRNNVIIVIVLLLASRGSEST